jgi:hypothetical protein
MPEIFLSTQVSLDGFAAGPDGDLEWTGVVDDEAGELMADQLRGIDAMIFGPTAAAQLIATRSFPASGAVQLRYRQIR